MSLDLYILSEKPRKLVKGTGIFVRDGGVTKELVSPEEIHQFFPNYNIEEVNNEEMESTELWTSNMTHNLVKMAEHVWSGSETLYSLLWHPPKELTKDYIKKIRVSKEIVDNNQEDLEKFNPPNGWGNYYTLKKFLDFFSEALSKIEKDIGKEKFELYASI